MSPQGPSSFIPKSPTKSQVRPRGVRKIYVFTYLSLVLFFGTLIASAGTFFFDITVKNQLAAQKQELANEQNAFNARDLERLRELENRIENAKRLLGTHVSVAALFSALQASTVATVQLTGASYERTEFGGIKLAVGALTDSLNDARFQRDIYASNEVLRKAGVIDPEYTADGAQKSGASKGVVDQGVVFKLAGEFAIDDIPYLSPDTPAPAGDTEGVTVEEGDTTSESGDEAVTEEPTS